MDDSGAISMDLTVIHGGHSVLVPLLFLSSPYYGADYPNISVVATRAQESLKDRVEKGGSTKKRRRHEIQEVNPIREHCL